MVCYKIVIKIDLILWIYVHYVDRHERGLTLFK